MNKKVSKGGNLCVFSSYWILKVLIKNGKKITFQWNNISLNTY